MGVQLKTIMKMKISVAKDENGKAERKIKLNWLCLGGDPKKVGDECEGNIFVRYLKAQKYSELRSLTAKEGVEYPTYTSSSHHYQDTAPKPFSVPCCADRLACEMSPKVVPKSGHRLPTNDATANGDADDQPPPHSKQRLQHPQRARKYSPNGSIIVNGGGAANNNRSACHYVNCDHSRAAPLTAQSAPMALAAAAATISLPASVEAGERILPALSFVPAERGDCASRNSNCASSNSNCASPNSSCAGQIDSCASENSNCASQTGLTSQNSFCASRNNSCASPDSNCISLNNCASPNNNCAGYDSSCASQYSNCPSQNNCASPNNNCTGYDNSCASPNNDCATKTDSCSGPGNCAGSPRTSACGTGSTATSRTGSSGSGDSRAGLALPLSLLIPPPASIYTLGKADQRLSESFYSSDDDLRIISQSQRQLRTAGWYHPRLSWPQASEMLMHAPVGTFLLRNSSDVDHLYSLSVQTKCGPSSIRIHYAKGWFRLAGTAEPRFPCIVQLVQYYADCTRKLPMTCTPDENRDCAGQATTSIVLRTPKYADGQVPSLKHLSRLCINRSIKDTKFLPVLQAPSFVIDYLTEYPFRL